MKFHYCATGTVRGKPWYTDGSLMAKGKPPQRPSQTGIVMDKVYQAATKNLKKVVATLADKQSFAHLVYRTVPLMEVIQPKYRNLAVRRKWTLYVGGMFMAGYNKEHYIVAKYHGDVVAIIAPMRKP